MAKMPAGTSMYNAACEEVHKVCKVLSHRLKRYRHNRLCWQQIVCSISIEKHKGSGY